MSSEGSTTLRSLFRTVGTLHSYHGCFSLPPEGQETRAILFPCHPKVTRPCFLVCIVGWWQNRVYGAFCNTYAFPVAIGTPRNSRNRLSEQFNGRVDNTILSTVQSRKSFKTSYRWAGGRPSNVLIAGPFRRHGTYDFFIKIQIERCDLHFVAKFEVNRVTILKSWRMEGNTDARKALALC